MANVIRTPDQRLRVFVSSTLGELAAERRAAREAIERLRLVPVMFELGARPHPPRELYRAYLAQSHVFVGIYWERYGWVAPDEDVSGLEDEYRLALDRPRLMYIKEPSPGRDPRLADLLAEVKGDDRVSYKRFGSAGELAELLEQDLAVLLTERFEAASTTAEAASPAPVPVPQTATIGRERDIAAVSDLLAAGTRAVTLTGIGGIGKTRVAVEVARAVRDRYGDRIHFVALASVTDPETVLAAVADRLQARAVGTRTHLDALAEVLSGPPTLLVLDNFEQLVPAAPRLADLLERCPGLQLLVTSRQALRTAGEHEHPVSPLAQSSRSALLAEAAAAPAVQLFVERAARVRPGFTLTEDNVADVVALCELLDGLPLAIELAAARLSLLSPAQLRQRLTGSMDLLVGGRDRPERQRTLRATIDWSHQLLDPDAQALFARLSVFAGGFTLEAAEEVCALPGAPPVLDGVAGLLDRSLLMLSDDDDEPRLRMLETVRSYAAERLEERGERELMRDRHLEFFRRFTDRAQPYLCGPRQLQWSARVDPERANLRAAVDHALERGDPGAVVAIAWDVYVYYALRGAPDEPGTWMARAAALRDRLDEPANAILETAFVIGDAWRGDHSRGLARLLPALAVFDAHDMPLETAVGNMYVGLVHLAEGDLEAATAAERVACDVFESIDHDWGAASSEAILGTVEWLRDDLESARSHYARSLAFADRIANEQLGGQARVGLAACALSERRWAEARSHLEEAVPLLRRCRDAVAACTALDVVATAALARDDAELAAVCLATAAATRSELGLLLHPALQARTDVLARRVEERLGERFAPSRERGAATDPLLILDEAVAALR